MTIREKVQSLIDAGNATTGNEDTTLTDVILSLIDGYTDNKIPAFIADFSGSSPSPSQFYSWEGRQYGSALHMPLSSIECENGVAHLTTKYGSTEELWLTQMMCTAGLFESDNFTLTFKAMFDGTAGSWNNVITYGTGTYWTSNLYSDGVQWPAGGEIDAFEQAGGYAANPNTISPVFHFGAGSNSSYTPHHEFQSIASGVSLPLNEWVECKFILKDGVVKLYLNGTQIGEKDGSGYAVNNEYLWDYRPFTKPQAFYIACGAATDSASISTSDEYNFYVKDFEVLTESKTDTPCTGLTIYPQMWNRGTALTFPTNAAIYFDRVYTPKETSNKACVWTSSNTAVATVVQGYVKTLSEGTCTITATCGTATASYDLVVSNSSTSVPCAGVTVASSELQIVGTSSTDLNGIIYKFPNYTTDSIQLISSDTSIVTVSGTTVTGTGAVGTATVTVKCGNASTTIPVVTSSGVVFESDIALSGTGQTISADEITYDQTQTYSFQYTFGAYTPKSGSTSNNCIVGVVTAENTTRNGCVQWLTSSKWIAYIGGSQKDLTPSAGDVITYVHNFADRSTVIYKNGVEMYNGRTAVDYFNATAKIIAQKDNQNMTVAPTHIKIAIGDLH